MKVFLKKQLIFWLKITTYVVYFSMFLGSFWTVLTEYLDGPTKTSIEMIPNKLLQLPTMTFCPEMPFKSGKKMYLEKDFVENTYKIDEIFHKDTIDDFNKKHDFTVHETRSESFGLCYSVNSLPNPNIEMKLLKVTKDKNLKVFIHIDGKYLTVQEQNYESIFFYQLLYFLGEEFWLMRGLFPIPMEFVTIRNLQESNLRSGDLMFRKIESINVRKRNKFECREYQSEKTSFSDSNTYNRNESFTECVLKKFPNYLKDNGVNCIPAFWKAVRKYQHMPFCDKMSNAEAEELR